MDTQDDTPKGLPADIFAAAVAETNRRLDAGREKIPTSPAGVTPSSQPGTEDSEPSEAMLEFLRGERKEGTTDVIDSVIGGIGQAAMETKDFLFGEPAEEDKWGLRRAWEERDEELKDTGAVNSLALGISQFATGMVGVGKLTKPIQAVQKLANAGKAGRLAVEVGKGAVTGAVVIDPHEERLSNLVERFPALSNPVTEYLAADPSDSEAEGRFKNALEGIGMDLALAGVFAAAAKALKVARGGNPDEIAKAADEVRQAQNREAASSASDLEAPWSAPEAGSTQSAPSIEMPASDSPRPAVMPSTIEDADIAAITSKAEADYRALTDFGSREEAIAQGYKFADGPALPWHKLRGSEEVQSFMDAAASTLKDRFGSDFTSDIRLRRMVDERAALFDEDPAMLMGSLMEAGERAKDIAADMEASFLIGNKMLQDAYDVAVRLRNGTLDAWDGDAAKAGMELKARLAAASDMVTSAKAMSSAAGRSLRRMRRDFQISPEDMDRIGTMDPQQLAELVYSTQGNPKRLVQAANPGFLRRVVDEANFSLTNSLLWLYPTHLVNTTSNLFMLFGRPTEKLLGSLMQDSKGSLVRQQAVKEYVYTLSAIGDGWEAMVEAFKRGDSVLSPHSDEFFGEGHRIAQAPLNWKPVKGVWDLVENGWQALTYRNAIGLPTRALGSMDEFFKTLRYRAVVQARAATMADSLGLQGDAVREYVERALAGSMDDIGRGIDKAALREAQVTTFQQELVRGTAGATIRNARSTHPVLGLVLPFVKTPVNVLRYAWKMTPGLNLVQKEFREALASTNPEVQAHAVGQMIMGSTFMALAAAMTLSGRVTGRGPDNPQLRQQLMDTGWRPYSIIWEGEDGKRHYLPLGRFDPVSMPFAMVADLVDMQRMHPGSKEAEQGITAAVLAISQTFTDRTFLLNVNQLVRAMSEPDKNLERYLGGLVGNTIPGSSAIRGYVNDDRYLREARSFIDSALKNFPAYSKTLPPKRNAFGQPMWRSIGLTSKDRGGVVEAEHARIMTDTGMGLSPPSPRMGSLDLRDETTKDGRNAYDVFQEYAATLKDRAGRTMEDNLVRLIQSKKYQKILTDGARDLDGTRLRAIADIVVFYRKGAKKKLLRENPELGAKMRQAQADVIGRVRANRADARKTDAGRIRELFGR